MKNSAAVSILVLSCGTIAIVSAFVNGTNVGTVFAASSFGFFTGVMYICSAIEDLKK